MVTPLRLLHLVCLHDVFATVMGRSGFQSLARRSGMVIFGSFCVLGIASGHCALRDLGARGGGGTLGCFLHIWSVAYFSPQGMLSVVGGGGFDWLRRAGRRLACKRARIARCACFEDFTGLSVRVVSGTRDEPILRAPFTV